MAVILGIIIISIPFIIFYVMNIWLPSRISRKEKEEENNPYNKDGEL